MIKALLTRFFGHHEQPSHGDFSLAIVFEKVREEFSLSQQQVADYLGTDLSMIKRLELGAMPPEEMVPRIVTQFSTSDHGRIYVEMLKLRLPKSAFQAEGPGELG